MKKQVKKKNTKVVPKGFFARLDKRFLLLLALVLAFMTMMVSLKDCYNRNMVSAREISDTYIGNQVDIKDSMCVENSFVAAGWGDYVVCMLFKEDGSPEIIHCDATACR